MSRFAFLSITLIALVFLPLPLLAQTSSLSNQYLPVSSGKIGQSSPTINVDLIVEADTYVPSFYEGRREPSAGNPVRVIALITGGETSNYSWQINGKAAMAKSETPNILTFTAPLAGRTLVGLSVTDSSGNIIKKNTYVDLSPYEVVFYEDNPLRGQSQSAIQGSFNLIGTESSILVAPYFIGQTDEPPELLTEWTIDRQPLETNAWRKVTLFRPEDTTRSYRVGFKLGHQIKLTENASGFFNLNFGL